MLWKCELMRVHIDTDLGDNPDDACALAMVLGWPGVELTAVTTVADPDGRRAGYVRYLLDALGRPDVPVAAGSGRSTIGTAMGGLADHDRYWGESIPPLPGPDDAAVDLLARSVDAGATLIGIGPFTNLARLERRHPGSLRRAPVTVMGGWLDPPAPGMPAWGPAADWNTQCDQPAAGIVAAQADLTLSLMPASMPATLRRRDLPRLEASGAVGALLARQSLACAEDRHREQLGKTNGGLPDDLVNFHWDPVACAVALGWDGATVAPVRLRPTVTAGALHFVRDPEGPLVRIVTRLDGAAFTEAWLRAVERAQRDTG